MWKVWANFINKINENIEFELININKIKQNCEGFFNEIWSPHMNTFYCNFKLQFLKVLFKKIKWYQAFTVKLLLFV